MKTLYFECNMGAAGDMMMAALLELHDNQKDFLHRLNNIGIPNVVVTAGKSVKCGITGTKITVLINGEEEYSDNDHHHEHDHHNHHEHHHHEHDHHDHHEHHNHKHDHHHTHEHHQHEHHSHNNYHDIEHRIDHLRVSDNVKKNALAVYKLIAEAESHAHGAPLDKIHFHEVGDMDAVADIVGVCMLIEELAPDVIFASAVNTGSGHIRCSHGILPVPAPATAYLLQNIPMYSRQSHELCTPTGAALLKHFVKEFREMPVLSVTKIGYGMGKKDFEEANCMRAFIGNAPLKFETGSGNDEEVIELVCNLDDMTPEAIAYAQQLLLEEGALDVWTTPIGMKKSRAGFSFSCMCRGDSKDKMISLIFKHTSTLGIRENICRRYVLQREQKEVQTKFGPVKIKTAFGFGVKKNKPEYDDIAKIAREKGIPIQDVLKAIEKENSF